jgi:prophage tail gpP-like protein
MVLIINDRIRNRELKFFNNFEIHLKYDSLGSTFKFDFFFDPDNIEHKELACIGHYHIATLKDGDDLIMTGYVLSEVFTDAPNNELVAIAGYSLPGVLQDCQIPIGEPRSWIDVTKKQFAKIVNKVWPGTLQSDGLTLKEIAEKILNPFGLEMVIDASVSSAMNETYDENTAKEKQTAKSYLSQLAAQKNIIITDDKHGRVVFTRPGANKQPIFHFERGKSMIPGTKFVLSFNGQGMHSHIKVVQQQDIDDEIAASEDKIENPYVPIVFRPCVTVQNSGDANDTQQSAKNVLSKELKNFTLTIETDRWRVNGHIFMPGDIISVTNPKVYLYKKSNWLIEEVTLKGDAEKTVATLKCVIPETYNGQTPKYLFAGLNLH